MGVDTDTEASMCGKWHIVGLKCQGVVKENVHVLLHSKVIGLQK
jgi:hypothetical protein